MKRNLLAIAVMSVGLTGVVSTSAFAAPAAVQFIASNDNAARRVPQRWEDLPRDVRESINHERGNMKFLNATRVTRGDRVTYRVQLSGPDQRDYLVILDRDGRVLGERNITEEGKVRVGFDSLPREARRALRDEARSNDFEEITQVTRDGKTWYVAETEDGRIIRIDDRGELMGRPRYLSDRNDRDRDNRGRPEEISMRYDDLPGRVRNAVERERSQERVQEVTRVDYRGRTNYRIHLVGPAQRERILRVDEDGDILGTRNVTDEGRLSIRFESLPGPAKNALVDIAPKEDYENIRQVTRDGKTWFVAELYDGRVVRVDAQGNITDRPRDLPNRRDNNRRDVVDELRRIFR